MIYFIVYWGYSKFVCEFMFIMYLVMNHMHWICYDFEHSSSIWSVAGRILIYVILFDFFPPQIIVFIYLFVHILEKWRYGWEKRIGIWASCAYIDRHRDIGVYEICRNRRKKTKKMVIRLLQTVLKCSFLDLSWHVTKGLLAWGRPRLLQTVVSKSRPHEPIWLLSVFNSVQL